MSGAAWNPNDLRPPEAPAKDIQRLAPHVLLAHVDDALEPVSGTYGRGRYAVLAGAGFGDDPLLSHPSCEEHLPDRVVDLVGARVIQVLPLEDDAGADPLRQ